MEKIMKTAKNLVIIAKTAYWTCISCAFLLAGIAIAILFQEDSMLMNTTTSLALGAAHLEFTSLGTPSPDNIRFRLVTGLIIVIVLVIFLCAIIRIIRNILEPMTHGKPFTTAVSKNLHHLAILSLIAGAFYELSVLVHTMLTYANFQVDRLFNSQFVSNVTMEYKVDLWFVGIFIIVQLLSYIFQYGEALQQLSDETL